MNTVDVLGIVLSVLCLVVALAELQMRSDAAGKRLAGMSFTVAWLAMANVAYSQHRQCDNLRQRSSLPAAEEIAERAVPQWSDELPDGSRVEFSGTTGLTHLMGDKHEWLASDAHRM